MEQKKNWVQRHPIWSALIVIIGLPILISAISNRTNVDSDIQTSNNQPAVSANPEPAKQKVAIPVEIVSSKITKDSIGTPILNLTLKNNSDKTVDAIEIYALFFDNFDEPAGQFGVGDNSIIATSQEKINPGQTITREWNLAVYDSATKVDGVTIKRVHFTDGETLSND